MSGNQGGEWSDSLKNSWEILKESMHTFFGSRKNTGAVVADKLVTLPPASAPAPASAPSPTIAPTVATALAQTPAPAPAPAPAPTIDPTPAPAQTPPSAPAEAPSSTKIEAEVKIAKRKQGLEAHPLAFVFKLLFGEQGVEKLARGDNDMGFWSFLAGMVGVAGFTEEYARFKGMVPGPFREPLVLMEKKVDEVVVKLRPNDLLASQLKTMFDSNLNNPVVLPANYQLKDDYSVPDGKFLQIKIKNTQDFFNLDFSAGVTFPVNPATSTSSPTDTAPGAAPSSVSIEVAESDDGNPQKWTTVQSNNLEYGKIYRIKSGRLPAGTILGKGVELEIVQGGSNVESS